VRIVPARCCCFSKLLCLTQSFSCSVVTTNKAPYTVVHVNAAFTRVTGLSSVKTVGRPFQDLVESPLFVDVLKECSKGLTSTVVPNQGFKTKPFVKKPLVCNVSVSPVGIHVQSTTHLTMELKVRDDENEKKESSNDTSRGYSVFQVG
jgi:hypothetical protein